MKACSRPRTRKGRRKPKWQENPLAARPCRFDPGPGYHHFRSACFRPESRWQFTARSRRPEAWEIDSCAGLLQTRFMNKTTWKSICDFLAILVGALIAISGLALSVAYWVTPSPPDGRTPEDVIEFLAILFFGGSMVAVTIWPSRTVRWLSFGNVFVWFGLYDVAFMIHRQATTLHETLFAAAMIVGAAVCGIVAFRRT